MLESDHTTRFKKRLIADGYFVQKLAGSAFQRGVPDTYLLSPEGKSIWAEMKHYEDEMPEVVGWLRLFGDKKRALQDIYIREVFRRNPRSACVIVARDDPDRWTLYQPNDSNTYRIAVTGYMNIKTWLRET